MSSSTVICRKLEIDAGHRLPGHESKCRHVHGHRYVFEIFCTSKYLDAVGRVVDFSVIKERVGGWLDEFWDHGFIAQDGDPIIDWLNANRMKVYVVQFSPSAEHLARFLFDVSRSLLLDTGIEMVAVTCHETPNCQATYGLSG